MKNILQLVETTMPDYPPQHAGTSAHPEPKSTRDSAARTEDEAAREAPVASVGTFTARRDDFSTPREGRNRVAEGLVDFLGKYHKDFKAADAKSDAKSESKSKSAPKS